MSSSSNNNNSNIDKNVVAAGSTIPAAQQQGGDEAEGKCPAFQANPLQRSNPIPNYILGALVAAGGVMGYIKAKSKASLAAGLGIGAAYVTGGALISNHYNALGHEIALIGSVVLGVEMGIRFVKTRKFMPAGMAAFLGIYGTVFNGSTVMRLTAMSPTRNASTKRVSAVPNTSSDDKKQ